jgi:hypothetical protein
MRACFGSSLLAGSAASTPPFLFQAQDCSPDVIAVGAVITVITTAAILSGLAAHSAQEPQNRSVAAPWCDGITGERLPPLSAAVGGGVEETAEAQLHEPAEAVGATAFNWRYRRS